MIAASLVAQAIFLAWRWRSPETPAGATSIWVFPGYIIAWAAPTQSMLWALPLTVLVNLTYHLVVAATIGASWRAVRRAV